MVQLSKSIETAVANSSEAMDARYHFKNGASLKSQMSKGNILRKVFFVLFFAVIIFNSCDKSGEFEKKTDQIIDVWKLISTDTGPKGGEGIKIITKSHFLWIHAINNIIVSSAGGTYTFNGETYTENIEFGTEDMSFFFGKKGVIKVRFDGNKKYYTGLLAEIVPFNEVWERGIFPESSEEKTDQMIGVWKLISTDTGSGEGERIKIITKDIFIWTDAINNTIVSSAGGTYTFDGETYTENIEFGSEGMSYFLGKKGVIKVRFDGNKKYYTGLLAETVSFNEVWERIE